MNTTLWIVAVLLAVAFLAAGAMKLAQPKAKLAASGQAWTENFSDTAIKGIGALEVLAAIGLLLPAMLDKATILVPLAASGLVLLMLGAAITSPTMLVTAIVTAVEAPGERSARFGSGRRAAT